ncbi:hypothetical protein BKI52_42105 [marine bacterium AO1-C]|nr:hypothetical protein BKI52_42105 [marine bacterium AO1-C]
MSDLAQQLIAECKRTKSKFLDLGNCGLTEWPEELFDCVWLEELNLGMNYKDFETGQLYMSENSRYTNTLSVIPVEIGMLVNLKNFYFNGFGFIGSSSITPASFSRLGLLENLEVLDLSSHRIYELDFIAKLKKIKNLRLSGNVLQDASSISFLLKLEHLDLSYNHIIDFSFLSHLRNLKILDISHNNCNKIHLDDNLVCLEDADLSNNFATSVIVDSPNLKNLNLSNNKIKSLSVGCEIRDLQSFNLSYNQIQDIGFLNSMLNLKTLTLNDNQILHIFACSRLKGLKNLNLSNNKVSNLRPLAALVELEQLVINSNDIDDVSFLSSLGSIKFLDLSNNKITNLKFLIGLKTLSALHLNRNKITDASFLRFLPNLKVLSLSFNKIRYFDFLLSLNILQKLDLRGCSIKNVSFLTSLSSVTSLSLSNNRIRDGNALSSLSNLKALSLNYNEIRDISFLQTMTNLQTLYLSYNKVSNVNILSHLKKLTNLDLSNNDITDISFMSKMVKLFRVDLRNNQINDLKPCKNIIEKGGSLNLEKHGGSTIDIHANPVKAPPIEIIEAGRKAILSYFQQLEVQEKTSIYEAKTLIVGEPGAGKTTLLNKLLDESYEVPNEEKSTVGINVHEGWSFPYANKREIQFKANLWDFGGQEIQYMLHQFFLTPRSLYVLLADDRKQNTNFPYWFRIIHLLGKDAYDQTHSPILVVLNENKHQSVTNFDLLLYRKQYEELNIQLQEVDFSKNDDRYFALVKRIQQMLSDLPHIGKAQLPANWVKIRQELQERRESYISFDQYAEICERHQITKQVDQLVLSRFLHDLGIILHFQQDAGDLRNFIILKPEWAVDAIYSLLTNTEVVNNNGRFTQDFVCNIWQKQGYGFVEQGYLLALMKKDVFEICFPTLQAGEFITPLLLPTQAAQYPWGHQAALRFRYQYAFMPPGILTRLIVRQSEFIITHQDEEMVWKEGVYLKKEGCRIQIVERETREEGSKVIDISVIGGSNYNRKFVLRSIRDEINDIHRKSFPSLKPFEKVPCICEECAYRVQQGQEPYYHDFDTLLRFQRKGRMQRTCDKSAEDVYIHALLEGVYDNEEWQRKEVSRMGH